MNEQPRATAAFVFGNPAAFLAFGFGSGLSPLAPGTMGTLAAIPFALLLKMLPMTGFWAVLVLLFAFGVYLCGVTGKRLGQHDPGGIVWDEMVAYWLTVAFLPVTWQWFLAAFVLFRVFDIVKPWPIPWVERQFGGGLGIMLDDIVAALYAMLILFLAGRYLLPLFQPA
jgi:phosphatidylglycerophosphatase A